MMRWGLGSGAFIPGTVTVEPIYDRTRQECLSVGPGQSPPPGCVVCPEGFQLRTYTDGGRPVCFQYPQGSPGVPGAAQALKGDTFWSTYKWHILGGVGLLGLGLWLGMR